MSITATKDKMTKNQVKSALLSMSGVLDAINSNISDETFAKLYHITRKEVVTNQINLLKRIQDNF